MPRSSRTRSLVGCTTIIGCGDIVMKVTSMSVGSARDQTGQPGPVVSQRVGAERTVVDRHGQLDRHDERLNLEDLAGDAILGQDDLVSLEIADRPAVRIEHRDDERDLFVLCEEQGAGREGRCHCERRDDGVRTRGARTRGARARTRHGGEVA